MIIAHAPSGYILAALISRHASSIHVAAKAVIAAGVVGALAPDFDMFYFHLIDNRQTHHHKYVSHWPIIWLTLAAASTLWLSVIRRSKVAFLSVVFFSGGVLHLVLDSFVGDIWWFAPFIDESYAMFTVPARFKPWWLSFILHWSFAVELAICIWALHIYRGRSTHSQQQTALTGRQRPRL